MTITTDLPRANGQIERVNRTIIPVLTKLSMDDPTKWYRHVNKLQRVLNLTYQRSIGMTPFELMFGIKMRDKEDLILKDLIDKEFITQFENKRDELRDQTKAKFRKHKKKIVKHIIRSVKLQLCTSVAI